MRAPLTLIPHVDRLSGGEQLEGLGYRVLRPIGTNDELLIVTVAGCGRFGSPTDPDLIAEPGHATLIRPGTPHDYGVELTLQSWEIVFCHFHPRPEWGALLAWPEPVPGVGQLLLVGEVYDRVVRRLRMAGRYSRSQQPRADLFGMNALEEALLWCDTQNPRAQPLDERILRVLEHLDQHVSEPMTVSLLARVAHLSPSRFAHLFRTQLGLTPMAYVERQRIALARQMLDLTDRPVGMIARSAGFTDPLYFSTRFRRLVGSSPSRYRSRRV